MKGSNILCRNFASVLKKDHMSDEVVKQDNHNFPKRHVTLLGSLVLQLNTFLLLLG